MAGRTPYTFDKDTLYGLGKIQATMKEIAAVIGCSYDTVMRRFRDEPELKEFYEAGVAEGKISLRRLQFNSALESVPMQIHLGKTVLKQSETVINENREIVWEVPTYVVDTDGEPVSPPPDAVEPDEDDL